MVLENKLGITDEHELALAEERMGKERAYALYDTGRIDMLGSGSFEDLAEIHRFLFGGIYAFAGELRTVNLSKGSFRFASAIYLESALKAIEQLPQSSFDEIVEKYIEMNIAHPFREGNGRAMRIWLDAMMRKQLAQTIDWDKISREDFQLAMERSPVKDTEIKVLLAAALSGDLDNRTLLARSIDASYSYEGYSTYKTEDLL